MSATISSPRLARALPLPILRRSLADGGRSLVGWAVGLAAAVLLYLPLYPSIGTAQMTAVLDTLPPELVETLGYEDITSGPGYVQGTVYGLIGFALLTIAAVAAGAAAIAGAEESGRLELTLAHGVSRVQFALESAAAVAIRLLALVVLAAVLVIALDEPSELGLEAVNVLAVSASLFGLTAVAASVALAAGAISGRRAVGTAAGALVAVAGYVLNALGNQSDDLEWLQRLSPYDWAYGGSPITEGWDVGGLALLGVSAVLATGIATLALQRRDVTG